MYQATLKTKKSRVVVVAPSSERAVDAASKLARQFGVKSKRLNIAEINERDVPRLPSKNTKLQFKVKNGEKDLQFSVLFIARGKRGDWGMVDWIEHLCSLLPDGDWELHGLEVAR